MMKRWKTAEYRFRIVEFLEAFVRGKCMDQTVLYMAEGYKELFKVSSNINQKRINCAKGIP